MKTVADLKLDSTVHIWFLQTGSQGRPTSGLLLFEKGFKLKEKFQGSKHFEASTDLLKGLPRYIIR